MKQLILLTVILLTSTVALAEDSTTTETCANGAGIVVTGAVSGHKYCMSNIKLNWWNAHAWCDGIQMKLFSLDDCKCTSLTNCTNRCPELATGSSSDIWVVTATLKSSTVVNNVHLTNGLIGAGITKATTTIPAICK